MKGLELPVNTLVVIAIAVLVMLGVIAMYMSGIGPFIIVNEMSARGASCNQLNSLKCELDTDTVSIAFGEYDTLYDYCYDKYVLQYSYDENISKNDEVEPYCKTVICSCPGVSFDGPIGDQ